MISGIDPKVDVAFKLVFGSEQHTHILAHLLNAVLMPQPGHEFVDLKLLNPHTEKYAADDKLSIVDVRARDSLGRQLDIETQLLEEQAFKNRVLYYWSRLHLTQLNRSDKYKALRPTISICIVDFELFPNIVDFRLDFKLQNNQHKCVFCDDIEVLTLEVPKFTMPASEIKTPLEQWMYFLRFGDKLDIENLPKTITSPEIHEALEALLLMSKDRLGRERYEARLRVRQDAYSFREGWKEAFLEQGEIRGEIRGRREGQREAALAIILRQLDKQLGTLNPDFKSRVTALGVERLESLGEALLKFRGIEDLSEWLLMNS